MPLNNDPTVDPQQLASMAAAVVNSLPNTCSIVRKTTTPNGAGGKIENWNIVATGVKCAFGPFRVPFLEQIAVGGTREDSKTRWQFIFPLGTDVTVLDRVSVDGNFMYEISSPRGPQSYALYEYFLCELLQ